MNEYSSIIEQAGDELGGIEAQINRAKAKQAMAKRLLDSGYIPNSGWLGALAQVFSTFQGSKLDRKANESISEALERKLKAELSRKEAEHQRTLQDQRDAANVAFRRQVWLANQPKWVDRGGGAGGFVTPPALVGEMPDFEQPGMQPQTPGMESVQAPPMAGAQEVANGPMTYAQAISKVQQLEASTNTSLRPEVRKEMIKELMAGGTMDVADTGGMEAPPQQPMGGGAGSYQEVFAPLPKEPKERGQWEQQRDWIAENRPDQLEAFMLGQLKGGGDKNDDAELRKVAAADSAQETIDTIDALTAADGYGDLGTVYGDFATLVPFIRTDAKNAQGQLDTIGHQIALSVLAQLKTLSAQGATGFGALTAPELKLVRNSAAALDAGNLSHTQLDKNLRIIRDKMEKIRNHVAANAPAAPAAPAIDPAKLEAAMTKYGVPMR